jgi:nucleoside-diphosphate-sugar epimerase
MSSVANAPGSAGASLAGSRVFVTGGSGFLGGALIQQLVTLGVKEARAIGRSNNACEKITSIGGSAVQGDLGNINQLVDGMKGCSVVFHCAAHVGDTDPYPLFHQSNVIGTSNVIDACKQAGVKRLVHVSTEAVLVNDECLPLNNVNEDHKLAKPASELYPYSKSKAEAERLVLEANGSELTTVACRPRLIWGKGDTVIFPRLAEAARGGMLAYMGHENILSSTCNINNVVEGMLLAATAPANICGGKAYFLTDDKPRTVKELWSAWLGSHDIQPPKRSIPFNVAFAAAVALENGSWLLNKITGINKAPIFTRQSLALLGRDITVDSSRARKELGYTAHVPFLLGVAEMKEEYEKEKAAKAAAGASNSK